MSDGVESQDPTTPSRADTSHSSAGAMLRRAREEAGLHVGALAVMMKIPVKKLEALEADQLDQLHDAVFVRALAASVCRNLHIDSAPVLEKLPITKAPQLQVDERGLNAPFRVAGEDRRLSLRPLLTNPAAVIVALLLVAALAVYVFPEIRPRETVAETTAEPVLVQEAPSSAAPRTSPMPEAPKSTAPTPPAQVTLASAPARVSVIEPALAASMPMPVSPTVTATPSKPVVVASMAQAAASSPKPAASASAALPTDGILVFKARGTTWVKVSDAKSNVLLSKTLAAGDQVGVSGSLPLAVVIGRSDMTDVLLRGQPFVMQGVSKDNVARFEVK